MKTRFIEGQRVRVRKELEEGQYGNYTCTQTFVSPMLEYRGAETTITILDPEGRSHRLNGIRWSWHDLFLEPVE